MVRSRFDQVVEFYVKSKLSDEEKTNLSSIDNFSAALKKEILSDLRDEEIRRMQKDVKEQKEQYLESAAAEAKKHKKKIMKKAEKSLICEAIFIAFLVGMTVNQVTNLLPPSKLLAVLIILSSLFICNLILWLETGKD